MKKMLTLAIVALLLVSCSESFEKINYTKINDELAIRKDIKSPAQVAYYISRFKAETGSFISVDTVQEQDGSYTITIINQSPQDDSACGEKYIIKVRFENNIWKVFEILYNWRCCPHRGGSEQWGTQLCP